MNVRISDKELHERCLVDVAAGSDFTIYNLPLGIFRTADRQPGVGMAIGEDILDLRIPAAHGIFKGLIPSEYFEDASLNRLMALGLNAHDALRRKVQDLLTGQRQGFALFREEALVPQHKAEMLMPVEVGDYTDFYSSEAHARNVGKLFRSEEDALMPNWKHLPVGYHGRSSSIVVSGTDIRRPRGQTLPSGAEMPVFGPSRRLDFELELAAVVGRDSELGEPVAIGAADDHLFGFLLMNDWSARDIQQWEYRPLGPFLGKSFATSVSPWMVSHLALEPYRTKGPEQVPPVLGYLKTDGMHHYDIQLEVTLETGDGKSHVLTRNSAKDLYWSAVQQLAHQTVNGCNVRSGDLLASGTISGKEPSTWGSLLEQTFNGREPLKLSDGSTRTFLENGDTVVMRGWAGEGPFRVGFGEVRGRILPVQTQN